VCILSDERRFLAINISRASEDPDHAEDRFKRRHLATCLSSGRDSAVRSDNGKPSRGRLLPLPSGIGIGDRSETGAGQSSGVKCDNGLRSRRVAGNFFEDRQ